MADIKMRLDDGFRPIWFFNKEFAEAAENGGVLTVSVLRDGGFRETRRVKVLAEGVDDGRNLFFAERFIKSALWIYGGYEICLNCDKTLFDGIKNAFSKGSARAFDVDFFENVYDRPFSVVFSENVPDSVPQYIDAANKGGGARIGFDAGGSDMKVAAVLDGNVIYSNEIVWNPKTESNPDYHSENIRAAIASAAEKLPRIDSIGVSSAGIYVGNETRVASLFLKVPPENYRKIRTIYTDIAAEYGVPMTVCNDGDVAAVAGAMELKKNNLLGIAMGTSEAAGFVDGAARLRGWLSELAFVPVDVNTSSAVDEWSGDYGTGVKYLSQDGVIKLAEIAEIPFDDGLTPAKKLKIVQELVEKGDARAENAFYDIGTYLGCALMYYKDFYDFENVLLMGRVVSGRGGEIIKKQAESLLAEYESEVGKIDLLLPDEKSRRVGQAVAAANL